MITIKIHDTPWFKKHYRVTLMENLCDIICKLVPKYSPWKKVRTVPWISGGCRSTSPLEGQILAVEREDNNDGDITGARYFAGGFWIPNWAIEWVKEIEE